MLKGLRNKKTAKKIWIFLAIVIVPPFILWGSGYFDSGERAPTYAGKIFGRKIPYTEYEASLNAAINQQIMLFGEKLREVQKYMNFDVQAWERIVLLAEAKKRKISATDTEVIKLIESYPGFQKRGHFDKATYQEALQYDFRNTPARTFEEQMRQNIILAKLYKELTDSLKLNDAEVREEYRKLNEEISIYYIAALLADFAKDATANEEEIKDYYNKNQLEFKQPLSFNMQYISLAIIPGNEDLAEEKIKNIALRVNKDRGFIKAAKEYNLEIKETGFFPQTGPIPGIGWSPEILNLIIKLKTGELTQAFGIDKHYYIFQLKERKEPHVPRLETIKDKVKENLIKNKVRTKAKEAIEGALTATKTAYYTNPKSVDFNKIAKDYGIKSESTGLFKYGSYIEGIGGSDIFWTTAKSLKEDQPSNIIDTPFGLYIIKLKSRVPVDENKFKTELPDFSNRLLLQKKDEFFAKFLEELKRKAITY